MEVWWLNTAQFRMSAATARRVAANTDAASRVRATRRRFARCAVRPRAKGRWLWIG